MSLEPRTIYQACKLSCSPLYFIYDWVCYPQVRALFTNYPLPVAASFYNDLYKWRKENGL